MKKKYIMNFEERKGGERMVEKGKLEDIRKYMLKLEVEKGG